MPRASAARASTGTLSTEMGVRSQSTKRQSQPCRARMSMTGNATPPGLTAMTGRPAWIACLARLMRQRGSSRRRDLRPERLEPHDGLRVEHEAEGGADAGERRLVQGGAVHAV